MLWARRAAALFRRWLHPRRDEEELDAEVQAHFDTLIDRAEASGLTPPEARRMVQLEFGGREQVKQTVRESRAGASLEAGIRDVRHALRMLRKNPGFAAVATITLALGIGANTAVFSIINAVLLQPLPYPQADRIVQFETNWDTGPIAFISVPKFMAFKEQTRVFQDAAIYDRGGGRMNLTGGGLPEQRAGMRVSAEYFRLFGAPVALGRTFTADEDVPGGPRVAVISEGMWRTRYAGDPGMVGKNITVGGSSYQVVGVAGPGFHWDPPVDIWLPLQADPNSTSHSHDFLAAARLRPGVSSSQARAAAEAATEQFRRRFSPAASYLAHGLTDERLQDVTVRDIRPALRILIGTVSLVLLIASANVANLLLARASVRRREIAIRAALGARRRQILGQLLTESAVLSLAGGVLGLLLGYFGLRALLTIHPGNIPRIGAHGVGVALDARVLIFTLVASALTGILFGLIPSLQASRDGVGLTLKESGTHFGTGGRENRARRILVVVEISLAVVLLVSSALMMRSYMALRSVDPGFDGRHVLTMDMSLDGPLFQKTVPVEQLVRRGTQAVRNLPGVEAVATTCSLPLEPSYIMNFAIEGRGASNGDDGLGGWRSISAGYFDVLRIPTVRGRVFTERDDGAGVPVVVINAAMAKQYWRDRDPVGERITIGRGLSKEFEEPSRLIVGVVGDVRDIALNSTPTPMMYVPVGQITDGTTAANSQSLPLMWMVRTKTAPLSAKVQDLLTKSSGGLPVGHVRAMEQVVGDSIARNDFNATLFEIFAGVAVVLAAIGIYGLVAYSVEQRTHEIGIRMALGAQRGDVLRMVAGSGMKLVLIGLCAGMGGALALTRLLSSLLFGVRPTDPVIFMAVALALLCVGAMACYVPARRAARLGPMTALRNE
jgi:putative ABC transport system permease protein